MKLLLVCLLVVGFVLGLPQSSLLTRKSALTGNATNLGVYGGKKTTILKYPYQVIQMCSGEVFCVGVILNEVWVLTTGDCAATLPAETSTILAGSSDGEHGHKTQVEKSIIHPKYGRKDFDYDVALLKVKRAFKWSNKIQPANITNVCPKAGTKFSVAGWGDTSPEGGSDGGLMEGSLTLLDIEECKDHYKGASFEWTDRMACAWNKEKTTLCSGDWGVGFVTSENGTYSVGFGFTAIAAEGYCTKDAFPVILSNYCSCYNWIKRIIRAY